MARRLFKLGPKQVLFSVTGKKSSERTKRSRAVCLRALSTEDGKRSVFFQMLCSCQVLSRSREKYRLASSCPFVHLSAHISAVPTGRISVTFDTGDFMKIFEKLQFCLKSDRNIGN
jgi:hypothetical protein